MIGVVVVTHGQLATELLNAAETIVGDLPRFAAVSDGWHEDTQDAHNEIAQAVEGGEKERRVLLPPSTVGWTSSEPALYVLSGRGGAVTGRHLTMHGQIARA